MSKDAICPAARKAGTNEVPAFAVHFLFVCFLLDHLQRRLHTKEVGE